jgi:hypothetical protein
MLAAVFAHASRITLFSTWHVIEHPSPLAAGRPSSQDSPESITPLPHGTLVATQIDPIAMKFGLQVIPQVVPLHVAVPLAGTGHAVHELPHVATSVFDTHAPLHTCCPAGHVGVHVPATHEVVPPVGAMHDRLHIPQCIALEVVLTQAVPQSISLAAVQRHVDAAQVCPVPHARPQAPQCIALVAVSTHAPLQSICPAGH